METKMKNFSISLFAAALTVSLVTPAHSEDIEVYVGSQSYRQGSNAKVMIIFDNSGSMRNIEEVKKSYNPTITYDTKGYEEFSDAAIYFNRGDNVDDGSGLVPNSHSDSRRFNKDILGCETALEKLRTVGYYTGYLREYQIKGNSGSWEPLPAEMGLSTNNPVDCYDDIVNKLKTKKIGVENHDQNIDHVINYLKYINHVRIMKNLIKTKTVPLLEKAIVLIVNNVFTSVQPESILEMERNWNVSIVPLVLMNVIR